ncbi:hypothetical protein WR25_07344 [Diploscapter pachys]|uniref:C2H2-type domain-containing protein n=1 Tax=Diploscapter pachys TaxID=2018661 RepID=A0A2A2KAU8_9BILA|nr:hypothetical protein WR25_07344 [Diploscapter pachys]
MAEDNSQYHPSASHHQPIQIDIECPECPVIKSNEDELEIHIRTEHLKWIPYKCMMCFILRETEEKMIEHYMAAHNQGESEIIYVPNVVAKKRLKLLMDHAKQARDEKIAHVRYEIEAFESRMFENNPGGEFASQFAQGFLHYGKDTDQSGKLNSQVKEEDEPCTSIGSEIENRQNIVQKIEPEDNLEEINVGDQSGDTGRLNSAIGSLFGTYIKGVQNHKNRVTKAHMLAKENPELAPPPSKRAPSKLVHAKCRVCKMKVRFCDRRAHSYMHLALDNNVYRYICLHEDCKFGHHRRYIVRNHLVMIHDIRDDSKIGDAYNEEMEDRVLVMYKECFNEEPMPAQGSKSKDEKEDDELPKKRRRRKRWIPENDEDEQL